LHRVFTEKRVGLYAGVDPTAPSLHVGHMLPFMVLAWGYVWGLPVTFLVSLPECALNKACRLHIYNSLVVRRRESVTQQDG
jgi:hypothetical protein